MAWTAANPVSIGDPTKKAHYDTLWDNAVYLMSPYAAQGDIAYATAANTLTKLAKGTANFKMFMNAGATAPEWALGMKAVTTTREMDAATGTAAVTGVGFKPSGIICIANITGTRIMSIGLQVEAVKYAILDNTGNVYALSTAAFVYLLEDAGKSQEGYISTWGSDGFTISWTRTGATAAATATLYFMCFR